MKRIFTLFSIFGLAFAASAQLQRLQIGKPAPDFSAKDINGKTIKLGDYKGKIVVMEAYESGCVWSRQEYESGAMQDVQREVASNDVVWLIVNPGIRTAIMRRQLPAEAKKEWAGQKMTITDWIIDDTAQSLSKRYNFRVTPQMVVIDQNGLLAYTGGIDDVQTLEGNRRTARNYVRQAVHELLAGKKVSVPHAKATGCMIMYPGMSQFQLMSPMN